MMETIGEKEGADCKSTLTIPWSNNSAHEFTIFHESYEEPIEVFFNWVVAEGKEYLLLEESDRDEAIEEGHIDDYISFDGENYIAYPIMQDYLTTVNNDNQD